MLQRSRPVEISFHVTVTAEDVNDPALIIIAEQTATVLIQTHVNIIVKGCYIRKLGRTVMSSSISPIAVTVNWQITIPYENIIPHEI